MLMSNDLKLKFYDEIISISYPKTYSTFKNEIARLYAIDASDVEEFIIYFFHNSRFKRFIRNENEYIDFFSSKQIESDLFLENHEESKLFKKENNQEKRMLMFNVIKRKILLNEQEKLQNYKFKDKRKNSKEK